jgi:hypothetical protein
MENLELWLILEHGPLALLENRAALYHDKKAVLHIRVPVPQCLYVIIVSLWGAKVSLEDSLDHINS